MLSKIQNYWQTIRESLWFVPGLVCALYLLATAGILALERNIIKNVEGWGLIYKGGVEEAKAIVSLLLPAMITMTTLAVSITVVALSLSATQLGPRLIKSFMGDRRTQVYIGVFFGTVTSCFALTSILHDVSLATPSPRITISAVILACFVTLFVLLAFVNHVAQSSVADYAIEREGRALSRAIHRLVRGGEQAPAGGLPGEFTGSARQVFFSDEGYVQAIDYERLLRLAEEYNLYVRVAVAAGHYVLPGESAMEARPERRVTQDAERALLEAFTTGPERTPTQDIRYAMRHMVEIAIRALSPGINDSFTAIAVVNRLSAALARLFQHPLPRRDFRDPADVLRVIAAAETEADIIDSAFSPIRHAGRNNPQILRHMMEKTGLLLALASSDSQKEGLRRTLTLIGEDIRRNFPDGTVKRELVALQEKIA